MPEARFGGIRNFHVEHFRPKLKFPGLENDITNLYLACGICNILKCDDWPAEPANDHSVAAYPDPSVSDYNALFAVCPGTYEVSSAVVAGKYLVERVMLNRAQLVLERRFASALEFLGGFETWVRATLNTMTPAETRLALKVVLDISGAKSLAFAARPYRDRDTKRSVNARAKKKRSRS